MNATNDIATMLQSAPHNTWLALSDDQTVVVAHGATLEEAAEAAKQKGVDEPVLIWAPAKWIPQVVCA